MEVRLINNPEGLLRIAVEAGASAEYLVLQDGTGVSGPAGACGSSGACVPAGGQDRECLAEYEVSLQEGSSLKMVFLSLDGALLRNRIRVSLLGRHASCDLSGLCIADGTQEMDYGIVLTHHVPQCNSTQLFKNIAGGSAVTRFSGLVKVVPDAQKTEAYQANHNLLLGDRARAFTDPQLEIYADDVKCSHGATVGRLNPDELFYMRSRGIALNEAIMLQQMAFTAEVLEKISDTELRERMRILVERRLRSTAVL
ncbi:MAG: SufD family Fe-S cluster assembly protein [Bacteroidales bacterium]|nr:SufD family Fe-S cluster assembly protein [Bacteroidales bacterium]